MNDDGSLSSSILVRGWFEIKPARLSLAMSMCVTHCCVQTQPSKATTFVPLLLFMSLQILLTQLVSLLDKTMRKSGGLNRYRERETALY